MTPNDVARWGEKLLRAVEGKEPAERDFAAGVLKSRLPVIKIIGLAVLIVTEIERRWE